MTFGTVKLRPARTLVIDCPWPFADRLPGPGRGAGKHYPTMTIEQLEQLELPPLEPDCMLFSWRVSAMQLEALHLMAHWGFAQKTELVWNKLTKCGKRHFGMGHILRAAHEVCLVGTRGRAQVLDHSIRTTFEAKVGRHSVKPEEFYQLVERLSPGPYTEVFGRRPRRGWQVLGNDPSLLWNACGSRQADRRAS